VKAALHILLALAALLLIPTTGHAQTNLRAWHAAGQTWLVWEDNVTPTPSTYRIYMSTTAAVTNVTLATQVGGLFPEDWQAQRLVVMTLNPLPPRAHGEALAAGFKKQILAMRFVKGAGIFRQG